MAEKTTRAKAMAKTSIPEAAAQEIFNLTQRQNEEVVTRESQSSDYHSIAMLMHQLGYAATSALILEKLQLLTPSLTDKIFVATVRDKIVGSISLHALPLFHAAGYLGRITSMVVNEHHQGDGIGSALIAAAENWFKTVGCVKLEVTSGDHRPTAHRFYAKHGFLRDGQRFAKKGQLQ
ncbi:GNAT superfamily N-acetyltransferase [Paraburkholderia sp. GAS41]|uniref:GNAT family N-acetyltransferase n=1 Tax=Paraburkholderia sp. GAS41 TaxID=3035134 RepID=UPI003D263E52